MQDIGEGRMLLSDQGCYYVNGNYLLQGQALISEGQKLRKRVDVHDILFG